MVVCLCVCVWTVCKDLELQHAVKHRTLGFAPNMSFEKPGICLFPGDYWFPRFARFWNRQIFWFRVCRDSYFQFPTNRAGGHSISLQLCPTKLPVIWDTGSDQSSVPARFATFLEEHGHGPLVETGFVWFLLFGKLLFPLREKMESHDHDLAQVMP